MVSAPARRTLVREWIAKDAGADLTALSMLLDDQAAFAETARVALRNLDLIHGDDPLEDGKATSPEPEGDASPAYGIGIDWNEFHTGTRYPNGTD